MPRSMLAAALQRKRHNECAVRMPAPRQLAGIDTDSAADLEEILRFAA